MTDLQSMVNPQRFLCWLLKWLVGVMGLLVSCSEQVDKAPMEASLLTGDMAALWQASGMFEEGEVKIQDQRLLIGAGSPMSGVRFTGDWQALQLPVTDYEICYQARRLEGADFFGTCTFPVGSLERCVSLVLGGWGGGLVGISSIDYLDASQNNTRGEIYFEQERWYQVRIEVREADIQAWVDDRPMVNVSIKGRHLSLKDGEIDQCRPLGFATWLTKGEIRAVKIRSL